MGRKAKTDDQRMEEWLATASRESLERFAWLAAFALKVKYGTVTEIRKRRQKRKDDREAQEALPLEK